MRWCYLESKELGPFAPLVSPSMPELARPLRRSRSNRQIAGVIGGLAEYFRVDPTLLRVIYVVGSIVSAAFPGVLVYVLLWLLVPEAEGS
jgi:phage shock protein C